MYIIIQSVNDQDHVINVSYGQDITVVNEWVKEYLEEQIESLKLCPLTQDIKNISFEILEQENQSVLVKRFKMVNRGYIYNSSQKLEEIVMKIKIMEFDGKAEIREFNASKMWNNINEEINTRVIKQLDKDSLYQVFEKVQRMIKTKSKWTNTEYTGVIVEVIRDFKKELYSNVAKKLKRFGKRQAIYNQLNNVPSDIHKWNGSNCTLEAKDKLE